MTQTFTESNATAISGTSGHGTGVSGKNGNGCGFSVNPGFAGGVTGDSDGGYGVLGTSATHDGVRGESGHTGVCGITHSKDQAGIKGENAAGGLAGLFTGDVSVDGNLTVQKDVFLSGADCAEAFDCAEGEAIDAGMVLVIDDRGQLRPCDAPYDGRVAGVVSGAGSYRPAIVLDKQHGRPDRKAVALVGKVFCKADASFGEIRVGDLLTTSPTAGHAMRAGDRDRAFGSVIGKALAALQEGTGLVPILIALQ